MCKEWVGTDIDVFGQIISWRAELFGPHFGTDGKGWTARFRLLRIMKVEGYTFLLWSVGFFVLLAP